jgi:hypothetical protein
METTPSAQILLGALPFVFLTGFALLRFSQGRDRAGSVVEAIIVWAVISDIPSELLGWFRQLTFLPLLVVWLVAVATTLLLLWRKRESIRPFFAVERSLAFTIVAATAAVTLFIALTAAPNNWDSQAYHLPRIEHWIQDRSLSYYPSWNVRQNEFAPLSELLLLQTRILSGTDFYYLLIQWISMLGSIAAAFRITRQLGGNREQGWIAAVFLATLPIGILESTSTQNDYLEALFLMAFITLGLEAIEARRPKLDLKSLGLISLAAAAGVMTGLVKPIGFMLGTGFAMWFAVALSRGISLGIWTRRLAAIAVVSAILVGPFAARFVGGAKTDDLESLHFSSSFGVKQALDTLIRHGLSNLATGIPDIDGPVIKMTESVTFRLGLQTHRADTSDPLRPVYIAPEGLNIYHEDFGPNQVHMLALVLAFIGIAIGWPSWQTRLQWTYCAAWLGGILVFCSLIRFSLWEVRYHLPGFAAAAPIFALAWPVRKFRPNLTAAMMMLLALCAIPVLLLNQSRELVPLRRTMFPSLGRDRLSYLPQTRLERQFTNQSQMLEPYRDAIEVIARSGASQIGLVMDRDNFEYPIWPMLRDRMPGRPLRIESVDIPGATFWPLGPFTPDMIFWDKETEKEDEVITVGGQDYRRIYQSGPPVAHPNRVAVYQRITPG